MHFKKLLCSLLAATLMTPALLAQPITLSLQGNQLTLKESPILINDTVYLPLRSFSEALGYSAHYDKAHGQVTISNESQALLTLPITPDAHATGVLIQKGQAYLPLRLVSNALGYNVTWDHQRQTITLTKAVPQKNGVRQIALEVAAYIKNKDYAPITALFDDTLKASLSADDIAKSFAQLESVLGPIQSYSFLTSGHFDDYEEADIVLQYAQTTIGLGIVINEKGEISGFHTNQYTPKISLPAGAVEREFTFSSDEAYPLTGTLTLPSNKGTYPVVILVHGSGPLDKDETVYNTKFFRDLAYGLAKEGIATFRYDKRTYTYSEELANSTTLTLNEEVTDDALAAALLMQDMKGVNNNQIYLFGHSLGGLLIPMLNEKLNQDNTPSVAGYIMASAPARPLPDVILDQYKYIISIDHTLSAAEKDDYLSEVNYFVEAAKNVTPSSAGNTLGLAGFNDLFWAALNNYDQQAEALKITVPTLITQGERDYQVTMEDFKLWQSVLKDKDNFTLKSYPSLNHLYVTGSKPSIPDEYMFDSFADENYIKDLAAWIKAQNK